MLGNLTRLINGGDAVLRGRLTTIFAVLIEVALFGISSTQAANGVQLSTIMVFPALFTAGMSLIDTTDGMLILGVYGWAFDKPIRKLYYV
jgi:high-affinity nickel-transport protein